MLQRYRIRLRDGSVGGEFFSCLAIITLSAGWLLYPPSDHPPPGVLYRVIAQVFPTVSLAVIFCIGLLHVFALGKPNIVPWVSVRKLASGVELSAWIILAVDLFSRGHLSWSIILWIMTLLLLIAVGRRVYPPL